VTVIGLDDTDSRDRGMCTTYLATLVAEAVERAGGTVERRLLVRCNPAVERKTRGNAALALHTDLPADEAGDLAASELARLATTDDPQTSPGLVVAPGDPADVPPAVATFARDAVCAHHGLGDALALADEAGYRHRGWAGGHGRIGALAAVGAWAAFDEWTYEHISYREFDRCGTPREVDHDAVFAAADAGYPTVWDTVDRVEGDSVCVPHAPGPILHGVRGDDPDAVRAVAGDIESEPVDRAATFLTNQGTDAHLRDGTLGALRDGRSYRVDGVVATAPETHTGGHVHLTLTAPERGHDGESDGPTPTTAIAADAADPAEAAALPCVAFEPTKRFRDRVRALRVGDRLTVCGEVADGTLKLEKFAMRDLVTTEPATPVCPDCDRTMGSAGRGQGYRCRDCGTSAPGKVDRPVDRTLERGWYEVPPCARRHVAKPLVRGGFDAPTHPER
jgi:tRNA(Ile2)-agmatinylcytidine synthase